MGRHPPHDLVGAVLHEHQFCGRPLDVERARLKLTYNWVQGHTGHPDNERCDLLAKQQAEMFEQE